MEGVLINLIWFTCLVLGYVTCYAIYRKIKKWLVFMVIVILAMGVFVVIDLPFLGAAPFGNKYAEFMAGFSMLFKIMTWYLSGILYSAGAFAGVSIVKENLTRR